jgi:hypothetical protein
MKTNRVSLNIIENQEGKIISINGEIELLSRKKEDYYFILCPQLKTLGRSKISFEDALKDHEIELNLFLKIHSQRKTLKSALNSLGWEKSDGSEYGSKPIPDNWVSKADRKELELMIA